MHALRLKARRRVGPFFLAIEPITITSPAGNIFNLGGKIPLSGMSELERALRRADDDQINR